MKCEYLCNYHYLGIYTDELKKTKNENINYNGHR